jgi:hypothetical protein
MSNPLMNEKNHALDNCKAHYESIIDMLNKYDNANSRETEDTEDSAREEIENSVLSVEIKTEWFTPGTPERDRTYDYMILLSTGGPACRITGELDRYMQPETAEIQYQDWFTSWETYHEAEQDVLVRFASFFYYGE